MRDVGFRCRSNKEKFVIRIAEFVDLRLSFCPCGIDTGYSASADGVILSRLGLFGGSRCGIRGRRVDWVFVSIVH